MTDLPCNLEAERSVLGALLIDRDAIAAVADTLTPDAFSDIQNQRVYRSMLWLWGKRIPCDLVTLSDELHKVGKLDDVGGSAYLSELMLEVPSAIHLTYYADVLREYARRRAIIRAATSIVQQAYAGEIDVEDAVGAVRRSVEPFTLATESAGGLNAAILDEHDQRVMDRWDGRLNELVVPTGIRTVDYAIHDGFRGGELVILGGRPGAGKTAMAIQMAMNAAKQTGKIALIASLEMTAEAMRNRMICAFAGIPFDVPYISPSRLLTTDQLRDLTDQKNAFLAASDALRDVPLAIVDNLWTTDKIRGFIESAPVQFGREVGIVFIDHLDKLQDNVQATSVEQETAKRAKRAGMMGKALGIPVVLLSQLNRVVESKPPFIPSIEHLRYSGALEQDADLIFLLYRRMYYVAKGKLEANPTDDYVSPVMQDLHKVDLMLAKNRNGEVRGFPLGWKPRSMSFHVVEREAA